MLFVFETPADEDTFLDIGSQLMAAPIYCSNVQTLDEEGVLGQSWRMLFCHGIQERWSMKSLAETELQKYN